jgi:catechol 2,3-dioxygenase-like lactoylglutathione lyase family enzyme
MTIRRVVPNIRSNRLAESRQFYTSVLGFDVVMDMDWIVTLASPANPTAQISLMRDDGSSALHPDVTVEIADVDEVHAIAVKQGLQIVHPLTDESWGVRRFFVVEPNGLILNIMSHRESAAES